MNPTAVEALASAWASMDGRLNDFLNEANKKAFAGVDDTGTYEGYIAEAEELIRRLAKRGIKMVPIDA